MANNIVYFDTTNNSIQRFNSTDVAKICDYILEFMAANGTFTGSITVGTSNPIGTFTDTYLGGYPHPAANSGNVTIFSTTYTLSQINTATLAWDSNAPMYMGLDSTTTPGTVVLQENLTTLNDLADEIIDRMIGNYGVNAYFLGPTAPADGGLWSNLGALVDTIEATNTIYYLWKKLNSGTYTSDHKSPLKLSSGQLIRFTDTEIKRIVKAVEQRIVATGKGLYSLGSTAPVTGTWSAVGSAVDVRRTTQELTFTGASFEGPTFTSNFEGATFTSNFDGATFSSTFESNFNEVFPQNFSGTFFGPAVYGGVNPNGQNFSGPVYIGPPQTFFNPNATPFAGPSFFGTTTYTGDNVTPFNNIRIGTNINPYVSGSGPLYTATYTGSVPATYFRSTPFFGGTFSSSYVGPFGTFTRNFFGGTFFAETPYFGTAPATFDGASFQVQTTYLGPANFLGPTYLGPANFTGPAGAFSATYLGPQAFFGPGGNFFTPYLGPTNENFFGTAAYDGPTFTAPSTFGPTYTGTFTSNYVATYTGDYIGTYTADYTATYIGDYTGPRVDTPTTTVSTVYLWKRIA